MGSWMPVGAALAMLERPRSEQAEGSMALAKDMDDIEPESAPPCDASRASATETPASGFWRRPRTVALGGLVLACAVFAAATLSLGINAPFTKDQEPQSAQWIQSVAVNGNWLVGYDYYGAINRKPPFFYWTSALVVKATGGDVDEIRARLVSLVSAVAIAIVVLVWTGETFGYTAGALAFLFLLSSYGFASRATLALTDMLFTALVFIAYLLLEPALEGTRPRVLSVGVLLGFAILTKGPLALVLCGLSAAIYLLLTRRNPIRILARGWPWKIAGIALGVAALWYVPAFMLTRGVIWHVFLSENFGHFLPAAMGGTGEAARPVYYIAARLMGGDMPYALLIAALAGALWFWRGAARWRNVAFQLAFVLAVVLFFSFASSKRDDYILPAIPGLAVLYALLFVPESVGSETMPSSVRWFRAAACLAATLGCLILVCALCVFAWRGAALASLPIRLQSSDRLYAELFLNGIGRLETPFVLFAIAVGAGAILVLGGTIARRPHFTGLGLGIAALAGVCLWNGIVRPAWAENRSSQRYVRELRSKIGASPLYALFSPDYDLSFYLGRRVPVLYRPGFDRLNSTRPVYLIADEAQVRRLGAAERERLRLVSSLRDDKGSAGWLCLWQILPRAKSAPPRSHAAP